MATPARRFGLTAGTAYTALGVLGMAITGSRGFAEAPGAMLAFLEINPLQNLVHFTVGMALVIAAARDESTARTLAMLVAASFGVLGLLGLGLVGTTGNVLALNHAGNALHLATALSATVATLRSGTSTSTVEATAWLTPADTRLRSSR